MRPRFIIILLITVAAVMAIVFLLRPVQSPTAVRQPQGEIHTNATSTTPVVVAGATTQPPASSSANLGPLITNNADALQITKQFVESRNVPIEFYGRVFDQDSNALAGAKIKIAVLHLAMPDPLVPELGSKSIQLEQTSDANGRFEFHGETGEGYGVGITKDGYEFEIGQRSFGPVSGSFDNPVIFKMWSTNIHEKLITGNKSFDTVPDGRPYFINLANDTISESGEGDLRVWIQYTNQIVRGQLYDWSAGIEVINGGLLEEGLGSPMFEAPTDGYVPKFEVHGKLKGGKRGDTGERQFYLKLKSGQEYGQMSIDLHAPFNDQTPGLIRLTYAINPSGSRILR